MFATQAAGGREREREGEESGPGARRGVKDREGEAASRAESGAWGEKKTVGRRPMGSHTPLPGAGGEWIGRIKAPGSGSASDGEELRGRLRIVGKQAAASGRQ
ncbi:hypothetical protein chiPu_0031835 [Chiloscyllium punctatum]|uniref:Uncharacterized protein n=1 Tax=Chiloscyllium punctatum TaxID=137246 RepID=A0A401TYU9_CHIPU|nr:hypothetical protein [Chiloscyllium punctatum]